MPTRALAAALLMLVVGNHSVSSPLRGASRFDHLKRVLPALGIAVFAYDRGGSGQSVTKDAGGNFTILADDAIAAAKSLKTDPRIDPRRIGTWGLSQGGWISPLAASRSPDIAFVIAVSAPVVTADIQMIFRSEEHTSELQSLMRISYAVFCLKKKK